LGDDVPVAFEHNGELIVTFGDTIGAAGNSAWTSVQNSFQWHAHDSIARSTTANASDGLMLNFFLNGNHGLEVLPPPQPDGTPVDMGIDNTPRGGVSLNGTIYLGIKTGNVSSGNGNNDQSHDYSVLATFDETTQKFTSGRTLSTLPNGHFIEPAFYLAPAGLLGTPPPVSPEPVMLIFGAGAFQASNVYLSIIPSTEFASGVDQNGNSATRYFAGMSNGQPTWSSSESNAVPVVTDVDAANPTIVNVSVFYSQPLGLWLMVYDGGRGSLSTEGIYFTYSPQPWGPWSTPQLVFNACRDKGFGNFIFYYYATAAQNGCPSAMPAGVTSAPNSAGPAGPTIGAVNDPNTNRGHVYAPTLVERFTIISGSTLKLFYMFSTWNPYAVVMMESDFNIAPANYQGLWWAAPAGSESGWGINFAHQGDTIFASWFTYDAAGKGWWLVMTAAKTGNGVYSGTLYQLTGPAFDSVPFPPLGSPGGAVATAVGSGTLTFADANNGSFAYAVNGIHQTKSITREVFGAVPTCIYSAQPDFALATNYQDLWWAVPAGGEAGWGINLTHQGDTIFATWFTYDLDRTPMWLVVTANKTAPGTYSGSQVFRLTGPPFSSVPFPPQGSPGGATGINVGTAKFTFSDGNTGTFMYTVNGVTQTKNITRELFHPPAGTVCQ
jgi:Domain of unknown function (DUF4185)